MAILAPNFAQQWLDGNGDPLSNGTIETYEAGTSTPKDTYTDAGGGSANTNPIVLDADGRANIWLGGGSYKFILKNSSGVTVKTVDDVQGANSSGFNNQVITTSTGIAIDSDHKNNIIICSSALTLDLLSSVTASEGFSFTVKNASSGDVVIDPDGSETIDGVATLTIPKNSSAIITSDGANWVSTEMQSLTKTSNTYSGDNTFTGKIIFPKKSELTIDDGEITVTGTNHDVGAESAASSDNLHTINGGSDGMFATLTPRNNSETIVVQHDVGNIVTPDGFDIELDSTAKSMLVQFDGGLNKWLVIAKPVSPIVNQRFIAGMELSKDTDDDHDMLIKAGQCANEGATEYLTLDSDLTKQIDATWAEGDDAGGMFTGSVGNSTTYYIWLIKKTADGTVDAGYDTSSTGANAPSGWTAERLLGLVRTDSSANLDDIVHYRQDYKLFESGYKAISTSSETPYAHLLGKEPDHLWGKMLCTSDNIGWTAGEVCYVSLPHWGYTSAIGINVQIDATNLTVRINSAVPMFIKTSYSTNTITAGSWNIKYFARVSY